ncbi:Piwi domain-containing protein [Pontibacter locisalis]|uniref:Protein argonaute n=1 Tax=Pontibacter locisalis TaxID=1719035 RepID=A0ABW5IMI9_9BACT
MVEVMDEITNLFKINLSPFPRKLYILPEALKGEFPEAAYYDRTNLVTIRHDAQLRELPFDDEKVKQILYRYIRHKFSQHSGLAVLSKRFSEDKVNEVILPDTSHPSLGNSYVEYLQICQAFRFAIHYSEGQFYLSVEPTLRVMNQMSAATFGQLFSMDKLREREDLECFYFTKTKDGKMRRKSFLKDVLDGALGSNEYLPIKAADIIPILSLSQMQGMVGWLAEHGKVGFIDLSAKLKELTLLKSNERIATSLAVTKTIQSALHGKIANTRVTLDLQPASQSDFQQKIYIQSEPNLRFDSIQDSKKSIKVKDGLAQFGAYDKPHKPIRVLFFHAASATDRIKQFASLLQNGVGGYYGFEKHFHTSLEISYQAFDDVTFGVDLSKITLNSSDEHDLVIYQLPNNQNYTKTVVQAKLINSGIVSQCVREATVVNVNQFTLWNFALDLFVKAGYTPWTLYPKERLPNVDLFVGMSYSSKNEAGGGTKLLRTLACVNVFSSDGEWHQTYYNSSSFEEGEKYDFEKRGKNVGQLIQEAVLAAQREQGALKKIHIHYNKLFSKEEMNSIYYAVTEVIPDAILYFVSIADSHTVRLFNPNNKDSSQHRGGGIVINKRQLYYCPSGYSQIKTTVRGTPVILRVRVQTMPEQYDFDIRDTAYHMQALTKLNYKSTFPLSTLPATIAFSKDLAHTVNEFRAINQFTSIGIRNRLWWI